MSNFNALATRYRELTKRSIDGRWTERTLALKVEEAEKAAAEAAEIQAQRQAEAEEAQANTDARIARRGPAEKFAKESRRSEDEGESRLARAVGWALNVVADHEAKSAKFAKDFAENPAYAMQWSGQYFDHAARYQAAREVLNYFENGITTHDLLCVAMREVMMKAGSPQRSTSPTSNLIEQDLLSAWTKVVGYLNGTEFF